MMMFPSSSLWLSKCSICPSSTLNRSLIRFFINIKCLPFCISLPPFIRQDKGNRKEDTFDFKDGTHSLMNSGHTRTQFISKKRHRHKIFQRAAIPRWSVWIIFFSVHIISHGLAILLLKWGSLILIMLCKGGFRCIGLFTIS